MYSSTFQSTCTCPQVLLKIQYLYLYLYSSFFQVLVLVLEYFYPVLAPSLEPAKLSIWFKVNKLCLNISKSKIIVFRSTRKQTPIPLIQINNNVIECVENFNFLSLIINKQLKWNDHIVLKISRFIGVLTRLKNPIPLNISITFYNSLLLPHINYLLIVWGHQPSKLTNLQKKCIRIITKRTKCVPIQIHYLKTCIF